MEGGAAHSPWTTRRLWSQVFHPRIFEVSAELKVGQCVLVSVVRDWLLRAKEVGAVIGVAQRAACGFAERV